MKIGIKRYPQLHGLPKRLNEQIFNGKSFLLISLFFRVVFPPLTMVSFLRYHFPGLKSCLHYLASVSLIVVTSPSSTRRATYKCLRYYFICFTFALLFCFFTCKGLAILLKNKFIQSNIPNEQFDRSNNLHLRLKLFRFSMQCE